MKTTESVIRMGNDVPEVRHAPSIAGGKAHCYPKQLGVETEERKQVGQFTTLLKISTAQRSHASLGAEHSQGGVGVSLPRQPFIATGVVSISSPNAAPVAFSIIDKCSAYPRCGCEYEGECYES